MEWFRKLLAMSHTGKVLSLLYGALQAGISFVILKASVEFIKQDWLSMSITYAILSAIMIILSMGKEYISVYVDLTSPYHKERLSHEQTKLLLTDVREDLEEKRDYIHSITANLNNAFVDFKSSDMTKLENVEKILRVMNKDSRLANCGNSKLSQQKGGDLISALMG